MLWPNQKILINWGNSRKKINKWGKNLENIQKFQPRDITPNIFYQNPMKHEISMIFYWVSTTFSSLFLSRCSLGAPFKTLHRPLYFLIIWIILSGYSGNCFCNGNLFTNTNCYDKLDLNNASCYVKVSIPFILLIKWINLLEHVQIRATKEGKKNSKRKKKKKDSHQSKKIIYERRKIKLLKINCKTNQVPKQ